MTHSVPTSHPGVGLWAELERAAARGVPVLLTPDQCVWLLADAARLVEEKNAAVRAAWYGGGRPGAP